MAQILVTVDEDMATQSIRKAIEMIKGVVSTRIYNKEEKHTFSKSANNRDGMLKWGKIE